MKTFSFAIGFRSASHSLPIYKILPIFHNHCNNDEQYLLLIFIRFTTIIQILTTLNYNFKSISSTHNKDKAEKKGGGTHLPINRIQYDNLTSMQWPFHNNHLVYHVSPTGLFKQFLKLLNVHKAYSE